ncbi:MAG TPA: tRNA lysidine(34) synthetase TilS [Flavipsychrobacter sp.]|nr:tRNA lysidine(34) synthetase TilS [Flavipsychrobacter sp.]
MNLFEEFKSNWKRKSFARKEQSILLAVSGGSDSMVMCELFLKAEIKFGIAHCNFQLRSKDADEDETFVANWARKNNILFFSTRFETEKISKEWKKGIQETARDLRYEWLEKIRSENNFHFIATAHHANDNVETLLINLFRGTGMSGLHGIPEKNGKIIRPLLFATKENLKKHVSENEISYREDASNASDKYLRNAVRLHLLPVVEQYFPNAIEQMTDSINRFAQAEILYKKEINRQLKKLTETRGKDIYIPVLKLKKTESLETICYELFSPFGFSASQITQVIHLADAASGKFVSSATHRVIKNRDFLIITQKQHSNTDFICVSEFPCTIETENSVFHFSIIDKPTAFSSEANIACIDLEKTDQLILRKWRLGDYFYPLGMGMKKKKLSRFFIDQKIPLHEKEKVWVLESDKKIVWVAGMRIDERFKIKPTTQKVLKVELRVQ